MRVITPMMVLLMLTSTLAGCTDSGSEIYGCTDSKARNYNSTVTVDDGSCISVQIRYIFSSRCNGNDVEYLDSEWDIYADYAPVNDDGLTTWVSPAVTMYESNTMAYTVYSNDDQDCQIVMSIYLYVGDNDGEEIEHKEAYLEAHRDITLATDVVV